jgi:hypothetical protein
MGGAACLYGSGYIHHAHVTHDQMTALSPGAT